MRACVCACVLAWGGMRYVQQQHLTGRLFSKINVKHKICELEEEELQNTLCNSTDQQRLLASQSPTGPEQQIGTVF